MRISSPASNDSDRKTVFTPEVAFSTYHVGRECPNALTKWEAAADARAVAHQGQIVGVAVAQDSKRLPRGLHGCRCNMLEKPNWVRFEHLLPFALLLRKVGSS